MSEQEFYSQYGEDRILNSIFKGKIDGVCVEVGGYDGITGSNTYFFEKRGWRCLVVEPMPDFCAKIRAARRCELAEEAASEKDGEAVFYVAQGAETLSTIQPSPEHLGRMERESSGTNQIRVRTKRLDDMLSAHHFNNFDFISIDVEGHELSALKGFSVNKYHPRIILIEDNSIGTDREIPRYLRRYGYLRFKRTGCNDWYGMADDKELYGRMDILSTQIKIIGLVFVGLLKRGLKKILPERIIALGRKL